MKLHSYSVACFVFSSLSSLCLCGETSAADPKKKVTFDEHVLPVLKEHCIACHGPTGTGNPAAGYPALRAQHSVYTVKQLNEYANDARYPGAASEAQISADAQMMAAIAKRLGPEDIRNLASYIQGLR